MRQNHLSTTIHEAQQSLREKPISSVELTQACLERVIEIEPKVHAIVSVIEERALAQACEADRLLAGGKDSPLTGVPALIKEIQWA